MSFNLSYLTQTKVLTLTVLSLAVLSGCTSGAFNGASQSLGAESLQVLNSADPFDSFYGVPKKVTHNGQSGPKTVKSAFKASAPTRYVVKKGDTLWGISNKFLKNPAYWPEVWDKNQKVKNPHLIFPGDELFIYQGQGGSNASITEKLIPQIRVIRSNVGGEPISTLSQFLVYPRVLDEDTINEAPYIVDAKDANILLEENQTVYVKNLRDQQVGGEYAIFNIGKILSDPQTGQEYGREAIYNGFLEVERPAINVEVATAYIVESNREIKRGDRLLFNEDHTHALNVPITVPNKKIRGSIISLFDAEHITGQAQVITINRGHNQGMEAGFTVGVYKPGKLVDDPIQHTVSKHLLDVTTPLQVQIPPSYAGTAIVYKIYDDISYAVITESEREVKNGYKIGNP